MISFMGWIMKIEVKPRQGQEIFYKHGKITKKCLKGFTWDVGERKTRGKITTFSRASARNMRERLVKLPDLSGIYGVTFTVPLESYRQYGKEYFKRFWHNFYCTLKRSVKGWQYFVWRIELTENGVPHFHTLVKVIESETQYFTIEEIKNRWVKAVKKYYGVNVPPDYAVNIRLIDNFGDAYAYVSTHASKHKQAQLGWQGRQWGIIFRDKHEKECYIKALDEQEVRVAESQLWNVSEKQQVIVKRVLRKLFYSKFREQGSFKTRNFKKVKLKGMGFPTRSVTCSSRYLAFRQSQQGSHFLNADTLEKVQKVVNQ